MIGNDIVDLACAARESDWRRKGWQQKLFTAAEQQLILVAQEPGVMVWLQWSMKEAAYKIWNRKTGLSRLMPLRLVCGDVQREGEYARGKVIFEDRVFLTRSRITADFVHTVALTQNNFEGATVSISDWTETTPIPDYGLFKNTVGLPFWQNKLTGEIRVASLSHHGRFMAVAFME